MILCPICKPEKRAVQAKSQVVETRRVRVERVVRSRRHKTLTVRRIRRCKKCGYLWRTIEVLLNPRKLK